MAAPILDVRDSEAAVSERLCAFVIECANTAIRDKGFFAIGLSGGSAAKYLCNGLPALETDWSKWKVFFCDERHVPHQDTDCTYKFYKENLMSKVPLLEESIFPDNPDVTVEAAAEEYIAKIRTIFPGDSIPRFDLLILGMGPDGHTCSLFPGHPLLKSQAVIAPISDSPKPPPQRITMTFSVVNNAACCVFAACGAGKATMLKRVLEGKEEEPLPAARVQPTSGATYWFLDKAAASQLSNQ